MSNVFLSYARSDAASMAVHLRDALVKAGHRAWMDVVDIHGGDDWAAAIEKAIDQCDVTLALISNGSYRSEICRAEQMRTLRKRKRLIPLMVDACADRLLAIEHLHYRDFSDPASFDDAFELLIGDLDNGAPEAVPAYLVETPIYTPKLDASVARPKELEELRRAILGEDEPRGVSLTALRGMGGVGKTTLALQLCQDELVKAAFSGGIFWITIGRNPGDLASKIAALGVHLEDRAQEFYTTVDTAAARLTTLLSRKAVLLVLDDVWEPEHVRPLMLNIPQCRTLITTRDASVGTSLKARPVRLGVCELTQSIALMREWGAPDDPLLPEIADRVGHLPLALRLAAAQLGDTPAEEWLRRFESLSRLRRSRHTTSPAESCEIAFQASVDRLPETDRALYFALGIFPEDVPIPLENVIRYWRHLKPELTVRDCEDIADDLDHLSLLELKRDGAACHMAMHDLLLMYMREGLGTDEAKAHQQFLAAHNPDGQEWSSIDDEYIFRGLFHHLAAAGSDHEVQRLLFDFRWLSAKLAATSASALILDYQRAPSNQAAQLVRKALRLAATTLEKDREQLAPQLLARLSSGERHIDSLLTDARKYGGNGKPWLRPTRPGLIPAGGCLQQTFEGNGKYAFKLIYRGGSVLEAICDDGIARRWNVNSGILIGSEPHDEAWDSWGSFRDEKLLDERRCVVADRNGDVLDIVDGTTGECLVEVDVTSHGYAHDMLALEVLDDRRIITGSAQGDVCLWETGTGAFLYRLAGQGARTLARIDENRFASAGDGGTVSIWDVSPAAIAAEQARHTARIQRLAATSAGAITIGMDSRVMQWRLDGEKNPEVLTRQAGWAGEFLALDSNRIVGSIPQLSVWQLDPPERLFQLNNKFRLQEIVRIDDERIAVGYGDGAVVVWNIKWRRPTVIWQAQDGMILDVAVAASRFLLAAGEAKSIGVYDIESRATIAFLNEDPNGRVKVADNRYAIFVTSRENLLCAWDWQTGERFELSQTPVEPFSVLTNGRWIAVPSQDGALMVLDIRTRSCTCIIGPDLHNFKEDKLRWLDDQRIVSGSNDHAVRVWNVTTGECEARSFLDGSVAALDVADGNRIIAGDDTGSVAMLVLEERSD